MKTFVFLLAAALCAGCSSADSKKGATSQEVALEVSLKKDREEIEKLRADIPEEIRKSNDRLAEVLQRWKVVKTPPDQLRERFDDELRKERMEVEKILTRKREDFNRSVADKRRDFQEKQKEEREDFYSTKPKSDKRQYFSQTQGLERDRFNADLRDERDRFEDAIKEQRKNFDADVTNKRTEFKQEYPEYTKIYNEMKKAEEKAREEDKLHPKPYTGWPYKDASDTSAKSPQAGVAQSQPSPTAKPEQADVNKGGNGWPASDPAELNQLPNPPQVGH